MTAQVGCHSSHTRATECIKYNIARSRIVQDISDDRLVGHLRMVTVGSVYGVVFSFAHICGKGLSGIGIPRGKQVSAPLDELFYGSICLGCILQGLPFVGT